MSPPEKIGLPLAYLAQQVPLARRRSIQIQQRIEQATVHQVDLRSLDDPLADAFPPKTQLPHVE
jgi:hypothetical protein